MRCDGCLLVFRRAFTRSRGAVFTTSLVQDRGTARREAIRLRIVLYPLPPLWRLKSKMYEYSTYILRWGDRCCTTHTFEALGGHGRRTNERLDATRGMSVSYRIPSCWESNVLPLYTVHCTVPIIFVQRIQCTPPTILPPRLWREPSRQGIS